MQILHPFAGSVQQYAEQLADPDCYRPGYCPQCHTKHPLTAHGFYTRTVVDADVRRRYPRAPILMRDLSTDRLPTARVRLALLCAAA